MNTKAKSVFDHNFFIVMIFMFVYVVVNWNRFVTGVLDGLRDFGVVN